MLFFLSSQGLTGVRHQILFALAAHHLAFAGTTLGTGFGGLHRPWQAPGYE
jgi:hypothetical protein